MAQFDQLLRRGLMDANLQQYEKALGQAGGAGPAFSPQYLRERARLLSDPWGWMRRRGRKGFRWNWRLAALVAALLLLSACAYAVATGQFAEWFPWLGVDSAAPEVSEGVMSQMGTVIGQSQAVGNAEVALNAAVWDGDDVYLSLEIKSPEIPEEVGRYTPLYTAECSLKLSDEQWRESVRAKKEQDYADMGWPLEHLEADIQEELERGQAGHDIGFDIIKREGDVLTFQLKKDLAAFVEKPALTLHLENIAVYEDGVGRDVFYQDGILTGPEPGSLIFAGPVDFSFQLEELICPITYGGADVEALLMEIPMRFTEFKVSATDVIAFYDVLVPVDTLEPGKEPDPDKVNYQDAAIAASDGISGLWTKEGNYVDLTEMESSGGMGTDAEGNPRGSVRRPYPYPIDPATVTALDIAGIRVELAGLEVLEE